MRWWIGRSDHGGEDHGWGKYTMSDERVVRIGGIVYQVVDVEGLVDEEARDGERLDGQFVHSASEIRLDTGLGVQARRATLWHEVLHGVLVHAGFHNHNERQVSALAYGVAQVLRDNEWLRNMTEEEAPTPTLPRKPGEGEERARDG